MLTDFHLHTLASDGELDPVAVLRAAAARGVSDASITDHDTLAAYLWRDGEVFAAARRLGLRLTVGLEMDADLEGLEVHLLGFGVTLEDVPLLEHLRRVRESRFERARREIGIVNALLGEGTVAAADVFAAGRETLMKPHFIRPLLDKGLFPTYEQANAWYRKNVKTGVVVPKPDLTTAIALIHGAGGWTSLAHPGYYEKSGMNVATRLPVLRGQGLDGVELHYPYHACSPHLFSPEDEEAFLAGIREVAEALGLRTTRGSDCHTLADFEKVYGGE